jgi:superfamily I DNA/RNA helicase
VITETIEALARNLAVHILGGTQQLTYLINSIVQLKIQGYSNHPDLFLFKNFADLKEYADSPMGGDIKPILKLIETYGRERLLSILESTVEDPAEADVTITTAHKAKGLEWSKIRLANDFKVPSPEGGNPTTEETNILYVAASRALHQLDLSKCEACWPQVFDMARKVAYEQWQVDQMSERETNSRFNEVINQEVKALQNDVSF